MNKKRISIIFSIIIFLIPSFWNLIAFAYDDRSRRIFFGLPVDWRGYYGEAGKGVYIFFWFVCTLTAVLILYRAFYDENK